MPRLNQRPATIMLLVGLVLASLCHTAQAQRVLRIAAVVNDEIITVYDMTTRMRIVFASSGIKPTRQLQERIGRQVLRTLIDEALQRQEAKRRNVSATQRDLDRAIANLEKTNRLKPGTFRQFVASKRIVWEAMLDQIRAQIIWSKLIGRVIRPQITVGDEEVDEVLNQLKSRKGSREYRISEILLTVNRRQNEEDIRKNAERLVDNLKNGARFSGLARQFSQSASASVGGDLGWLQEETLDENLRQIVPNMREGDVAGPIKTLSGYRIIRLNKTRQVLVGSPLDATVDLRRIALPLPPNARPQEIASQEQLASLLTQTVSGCEDFEKAAKEVGSVGKVNLGKMKLGNLALPIRNAVKDASIGKPVAPLKSGNAVLVLMVCGKTEAETGLPSRNAISSRLIRERLDIMSRRYMRDLRSASVIDIRI